MLNFKKVLKMGSTKKPNPNEKDQEKYKEKVEEMWDACEKFVEKFYDNLYSPKEWQGLLKDCFGKQMGKSRLKSRTSRVLHGMSKELSKFKGEFELSKVKDYIKAFEFKEKKANPKDDYIKRSAIDDASVVTFFKICIPDLLKKEVNPFNKETGTFTVRKQEDFGKVNRCKTKIKKIIIGENIETIGESAFLNCTALHSIDLKNVKTIGASAFQGCEALDSIDLKNVETIGKDAFWGCKVLKNDIILNNNVKTVEEYAFSCCKALQSINLKNVETIRKYAFSGCKSLQKIDLSGVTNIGEAAFFECTKLQSIILNKKVETIGKHAFFECEALTNINLEGVTNIGKSAFSGCEALQSINLISIEKIDKDAFKYCESLNTVTLPTNGKAADIKKIKDIILDQTGKGEGTIKFDNDPEPANPDKPANH